MKSVLLMTALSAMAVPAFSAEIDMSRCRPDLFCPVIGEVTGTIMYWTRPSDADMTLFVDANLLGDERQIVVPVVIPTIPGDDHGGGHGGGGGGHGGGGGGHGGGGGGGGHGGGGGGGGHGGGGGGGHSGGGGGHSDGGGDEHGGEGE